MNIMIIFVCFMMSKVNMFYRRKKLNIFFVLVINLLKMLINKYIIYNINFMLYIDVFVVYVVFMVEFIYIIYQFFIVFLIIFYIIIIELFFIIQWMFCMFQISLCLVYLWCYLLFFGGLRFCFWVLQEKFIILGFV